MAAATVLTPIPQQSPTPPPETPHLSLETCRPNSAPLPNKHIPYCPPGSPPFRQDDPSTPPDTPPSKETSSSNATVLHPATSHPKIIDLPPIYSIGASTLQDAVEEVATKAAPDAKHVFPWLHGLSSHNQMQLTFFDARRNLLRGPPECFRGITLVKAGGDLSKCRLKGAVSQEEVLSSGQAEDTVFLDVDPREGFSVRNFQIQVAKLAVISDIVVYGGHSTTEDELRHLAKRFAFAQKNWRSSAGIGNDEDAPIYNTFVLSDQYETVETFFPLLIALDCEGQSVESSLDFFKSERREMCAMSKASEIAHNVWLGPTPDTALCPSSDDEAITFDILIEASDLANPPDIQSLRRIGEESYSSPQTTEFPSSGSIIPQSSPKSGIDPLTKMCQWIFKLANRDTYPESDHELDIDSEGDIPMRNLCPSARKILIHCTDGYTETTLLAVAYYMYAEQVPVHEAWLRLHCEKGRNFFAYSSDVALLTSLESRLSSRAKSRLERDRTRLTSGSPAWLTRMDGSLPSRILPYLYLGNLGHANNPELLKALGITQILSVGEPINWTTSQIECWGVKNLENVMYVDRVQDNGVDPLIPEFQRCLDFIAKGKAKKSATLVHCRVGVSRSATICIAEVMASLGLSFPRAYCFVRARRLNVIIQPHLRFAYELMKWDEICQQRRGESVRREVEWATLCREIAGMNRPYCGK